MKTKRKIWLIAAIFAMTEALAFPEALFPDCIRVKEVQQEEQSVDESQKWMQKPERQTEFKWKIWFLKNIKKAG